jgi:hypothetical protein
MNEIELVKPIYPTPEKEISDLDIIQNLYDFLQKDIKLSPKKSFKIIYHLQEELPIFPDHIQQCWNCKQLFDTWSSGLYWESKSRHYCGSCDYLVPLNYDRGKK